MTKQLTTCKSGATDGVLQCFYIPVSASSSYPPIHFHCLHVAGWLQLTVLTETLLIGNWDCCAHYSISFTHFVRLYATWRKLLSLYFKGREITLLKSFIKFPCKQTSQASFLHMHIRWGFCVCVCDCAWRKEGRCTYRYHCGITSATKEKRMWQFLPQLSWLSEFLL